MNAVVEREEIELNMNRKKFYIALLNDMSLDFPTDTNYQGMISTMILHLQIGDEIALRMMDLSSSNFNAFAKYSDFYGNADQKIKAWLEDVTPYALSLVS